jgi:hypothetical protein
VSTSDPDGLIYLTESATREYAEAREVDRLLAIISALAGELAVLRARLDTHERLAAQPGSFDRARVESYVPSAEVLAERQADTAALIERVFEPIQQDLEALRSDESAQSALIERLTAGVRASD